MTRAVQREVGVSGSRNRQFSAGINAEQVAGETITGERMLCIIRRQRDDFPVINGKCVTNRNITSDDDRPITGCTVDITL